VFRVQAKHSSPHPMANCTTKGVKMRFTVVSFALLLTSALGTSCSHVEEDDEVQLMQIISNTNRTSEVTSWGHSTWPYGLDYWKKKLPDLVAEFEGDARLTGLVSQALDYVRQQVKSHLENITENLHATGIQAVDLLWPGDGYNEAAYGGQFHVLSLLEQQGLVKISSITGASGGACSTILSLADKQFSGADVLKYNLIYANHGFSSFVQSFAETYFWEAVYLSVLDDTASFDRVSQLGRVACKCGGGPFGLGGDNALFYNFETREQAAKAYYSSGDASVQGAFIGTEFYPKAGSCLDGGEPVPLPDSSSHLLYYYAFYGHALSFSVDDVIPLFKHGVDETIRLLESPNLLVPSNDGQGGMQAVPGADWDSLREAWHLSAGASKFYNIRQASS